MCEGLIGSLSSTMWILEPNSGCRLDGKQFYQLNHLKDLIFCVCFLVSWMVFCSIGVCVCVCVSDKVSLCSLVVLEPITILLPRAYRYELPHLAVTGSLYI